jgi:hypothetical protein
LYEAYRIRPVVETTDDEGEVTCEAKASLAEAESECAEFEAKEVFCGREGKRIIWTIYGVDPEENGVRTEDAITDVLSEATAKIALEKIIGPFEVDANGFCASALPIPRVVAILKKALKNVETFRETEAVDYLALVDEGIDEALNFIMKLAPTEAAGNGMVIPTAPNPFKVRAV